MGLWHTVFGLVWYARPLRDILRGGYVGAVGWEHTPRALGFWFMAAGAIAMTLGALAAWVERRMRLPRFFGWALGGVALAGGLALPVSGFWLLIAPAVAVIAQRRSGAHEAAAPA